MCYRKPGPRCSSHARANLKQAKQAWNETQSSDAYDKLKQAQKEYDMTPEGMSMLEGKIASTIDEATQEQLRNRLEYARVMRKAALDQIKAEDQGDTADSHVLPLPVDPQSSEGRIGLAYDPNSTQGLNYQTDGTRTVRGADDDNDMRNVELVNPRFTGVDVRDFIAGRLGLWTEDDVDSIPAEWVKKVEESGLAEQVSMRIVPGPHGEEVAFDVPPALTEMVQNLYFSQPNARDYDGALSFARSEGVDTSGLSPAEAVKKTLFVNNPSAELDQRTLGAVERANNVYSETLHLDHVRYSSSHLNNVGSFDTHAFAERSDHIAGVVVYRGAGKYDLVGGAERFKTARKSPISSWRFLVLNTVYDSPLGDS